MVNKHCTNVGNSRKTPRCIIEHITLREFVVAVTTSFNVPKRGHLCHVTQVHHVTWQAISRDVTMNVSRGQDTSRDDAVGASVLDKITDDMAGVLCWRDVPGIV